MNWNRLDKTQSQFILQHIADVADPMLFSAQSTEASFKPLSFYKDYMVYRLTNFATLPSFSLDFLSDGETYLLLDGSNSPIETINARGCLYLTETNIIDYVDFYFSNIRGDDGDVYLIRDPDDLPFIESLSLDQQIDLKKRHKDPQIMLDQDSDDFIIIGDLFYGGTLLNAAIVVKQDGSIDIQPSNMIMSPTASFGGSANV